MPRHQSDANRVAAKRGRLYNKAFREMGFVYPSNKAKASAAQKTAYREVSKEFKKTFKSKDNPLKVWYMCSVKLGYLPTKSQRAAIRRRFKELERASDDKDIKRYKKKHS